MSRPDQQALFEQKARELSTAEANLRRYETQVEQAQGQVNHEIHAALRHEVWEARAALSKLRASLESGPSAEVTPEEIQAVRRRAQEDAIAELARTRGWHWDEACREFERRQAADLGMRVPY